MEGPAGMAGQPCAHLGMFVGGIVVDDGVDRLSLRHLRLDGIEEADELLMAVALHVVPDDGAVEDVEGGEQRGCAVTFVVMRKPLKQSSLIPRRRENGSAPSSDSVRLCHPEKLRNCKCACSGVFLFRSQDNLPAVRMVLRSQRARRVLNRHFTCKRLR